MNNENDHFYEDFLPKKEQQTTPHKPFSFLDYIKNPEKSDEKKIELHDYVSILNKENFEPKEFLNVANKEPSEEVVLIKVLN